MYNYYIYTTGTEIRFRDEPAETKQVGVALERPIEEQLDNDKSYIVTAKGHIIMKAAIIYIEDKTRQKEVKML